MLGLPMADFPSPICWSLVLGRRSFAIRYWSFAGSGRSVCAARSLYTCGGAARISEIRAARRSANWGFAREIAKNDLDFGQKRNAGAQRGGLGRTTEARRHGEDGERGGASLANQAIFRASSHRPQPRPRSLTPPPVRRKEIRQSARVSREAMGAELDVSPAAIYRWETGGEPNSRHIVGYVNLLNVLEHVS